MESTATMMESYLPDSGSSKMKSMLMVSARGGCFQPSLPSLASKCEVVVPNLHHQPFIPCFDARGATPSLMSKHKMEVPNSHHQPSISCFDARGAVFDLPYLLHIETRGGGLSTLLHPHHHPQPMKTSMHLLVFVGGDYLI